MFGLFIKKDFESKGGRKRKRKTKRKRESIELGYICNILTKDGIYFSYLKWICSSKENIGQVFTELLSEIVPASTIRLSLLL